MLVCATAIHLSGELAHRDQAISAAAVAAASAAAASVWAAASEVLPFCLALLNPLLLKLV